MRVLVVKSQLKPGYREQFMKASMGDALGANHDEPGCLRFDVIQDGEDPNVIYFYEVYVDDAAFEEHLRAPHFTAWRDTVKDDWYVEPVKVVRGWNIYPTDSNWK